MRKALIVCTIALAIASAQALAAGKQVAAPAAAPTATPAYGSPAEFNYNVRVNPLALALGIINADIDFGIGESMTFGPSLAYMTATSGVAAVNEVKITAYAIGARLNYYLSGKKISDSWYFAPNASFMPMSVKENLLGVEYSVTVNAFTGGALFGYQWVWGSGFNLTLGGGISYYSTSENVTAKNSAGTEVAVAVPSFKGVLPSLEFSLGFAF